MVQKSLVSFLVGEGDGLVILDRGPKCPGAAHGHRTNNTPISTPKNTPIYTHFWLGLSWTMVQKSQVSVGRDGDAAWSFWTMVHFYQAMTLDFDG